MGLAGRVDGESELRLLLLQLALEDLPRTGNGVALAVEQRLDAQGGLDIAATVEALAGAAFMRFQIGKLALPEAQHVGRNLAKFRNLSNAKVELVRDV